VNSAITHQEIECIFRVKFLHADIVEIPASSQASSIDGGSIESPILGILPILIMAFRKGQARAKMSGEGRMIFTHIIAFLDSVSLRTPLSLPIVCDREGLDCSGAWNESPFKNLFSDFWIPNYISTTQQVSYPKENHLAGTS
jgi:hypothetical protein